MKPLIVVSIVCLLTTSSFAQHERYELGRRLKNFEYNWDAQTDPTIRKRALADLPKVTNQFFSLQLGEAGRTLEEASAILRNQPRTDRDIWLSSIYATTPKVLIDASQKEIEITLKPFFKPKGTQPESVTFESRNTNQRPTKHNQTLTKIPFTFSFTLNPVNPDVVASFRVDLVAIAERTTRDESITTLTNVVNVSRAVNLTNRLAVLKKTVDALPSPLTTIEQATLKDYFELLSEAADGIIPECDISLGELLRTAEYLASNPRPFFLPQSRENWYKTRLSFPTGNKRNTSPTRVFLPEKEELAKPVPVVIALHGAGGSENLFVEGYGNGRIVYECSKRNWILISPRAPGFASITPVLQMVDQLAERFPIDNSKIFLIGHSMGAGQAIELCQQHPGKFAGVAALGGGGRVRNAKPFIDLPTFIGVGTKDFALNGSRSLKKSLADGGAKQLTFREYTDLEHLVIVREALPDVFAMFDKVVKAKPAVQP